MNTSAQNTGHARSRRRSTDTLLSAAASMLVFSAVVAVSIRVYQLSNNSSWSLLDSFLYQGQSLSRQFGFLVPALAALLIREAQRPWPMLRMTLRLITVLISGWMMCALVKSISQFSMFPNIYEKRLFVLSAIGKVALMITNLAIVFDERERF
jgi:hypothetical protein